MRTGMSALRSFSYSSFPRSPAEKGARNEKNEKTQKSPTARVGPREKSLVWKNKLLIIILHFIRH